MSVYRKYKDWQRVLVLHEEDPDLATIRIDILDVIQRTHKLYGFDAPDDFPDLKKIDGYDLEPKDQKFRRVKIPKKLVMLEEKLRKKVKPKTISFIKWELDIINDFWNEIDANTDFYEKEIIWLKQEWYKRLCGHYLFINGTPTYIPGVHYFYLNYWTLVGGGYPEYRDRDRQWFMAQMYALTETRTFAKFDSEGRAIAEHDGVYKMKELNRRVILGTNVPKSRRVGDTTKAQCWNGEYATRTKDKHIGIQGKDDDNAENVFLKHLVKPLKKLPIFYKPLFEQLDPRKVMIFDNEDPTLGLGTRCDFATSADRSAYDGYELYRYHRDEPGKVKYEDVNIAHKVIQNCCMLGSELIGYMIYTSTSDEMNRRGGVNYLKLAMRSMWDKRDKNGMTVTGMINIYFPAYYNLQGFVDEYGMAVIDTPTEEQAKFIRKDIGAKEFLLNKRAQLEKDKDWEGLNEEKRLFSFTFREAFTPPAGNVFFRTDIIESRISEVEFNPALLPRSGKFEWINGEFSTVKWVDDPNGHFQFSYVFPENMANNFCKRNNVYVPLYPARGVLGVDPFRVEKTEGGTMSDTGIAGFYRHDPIIDPHGKEIEDWTTGRFILTYRHRADTPEEQAMEVLKAALFTGFMIYSENNVDKVNELVKAWGYGGFLLYDYNLKTKKIKENPGFYTVEQTKIKIFNEFRSYIAIHGFRDRHPDLLREVLEIPNRDSMTKYDLFTAGGGCLVGLLSEYPYVLERLNQPQRVNTNKFFNKMPY